MRLEVCDAPGNLRQDVSAARLLEQTLDAVKAHGLTHIQFNMSCMGLPTLPDRLDEGSCVWIAQTARASAGLTMAAISGTFNMCDPSTSRLENNLRRLDVLAAACRWLDTRIITLCTGTRDRDDMWKWHPENVRRSTWDDLVQTMRAAVEDRRSSRGDPGLRAGDQQRRQLGHASTEAAR